MAQVALTINKRSYDIACDDGQEDHLRSLAGDLDARVQKLRQSMGEIGDLRLLVMAALLLEDELNELRAAEGAEVSAGDGAAESHAAEALESVAKRIESIAARLEGA
ncbi:MAG: cell division protein ZapA [Rhodovibrionaceae bacterium]